MNKTRIFAFLFYLICLSLLWYVIGGSFSSCWVIFLLAIICEMTFYNKISVIFSPRKNEGKGLLDGTIEGLDIRICIWIIILGIGIIGGIFCLVDSNWKWFGIWTLESVLSIIQLSSFFNKEK